jgi:hypothetical protein
MNRKLIFGFFIGGVVVTAIINSTFSTRKECTRNKCSNERFECPRQEVESSGFELPNLIQLFKDIIF